MPASRDIAVERFFSIKEAAYKLGFKYWKLQRAVKRGDIPSYAPFNSRRVVRLSEVVEHIMRTRIGGAQ
jgi:hypothetical protein